MYMAQRYLRASRQTDQCVRYIARYLRDIALAQDGCRRAFFQTQRWQEDSRSGFSRA